MTRALLFRSLITAFLTLLCFAAVGLGQQNPFAPQPAPPLPAGMTGSDASDPRATLKPGMFDAGETSSGLKLISALKKPETFLLPNDPADPKVTRGVTIIAGNANV